MSVTLTYARPSIRRPLLIIHPGGSSIPVSLRVT